MPIVPIELCIMSGQGEICTHEKCSMYKVCKDANYQARINQSLRR